MPMYDEKVLNAILEKNSIVDVVGRYCAIKKKGQYNYWACCPLPGHTEKTPSFSVNEVGQFYHCFGCGKSGNAFSFIMEVESVSFTESVKILADYAKVELPENNRYSDKESEELKQKKERLSNILVDTAKFYVSNIRKPEGSKYINYARSRGLDNNTLIKFGIGASLDYNTLPKFLKEKGYTEEEMLASGVCAKSENGRLYDFEAERLIIPIISALGKVIAFGGRLLEAKPNFAKYKNSSSTYFDKRNVLFNLNNLKQLKREEGFSYAIMVEGYMDVISLYQGGFKNVVASMGTSLTLEQAKLLKRYTDKVLVSYDGDGAGQGATIRSLDIFENEGFEIRIVELPDGLDPDDVIKKRGREKYQELLDNAVPYVDFKLKCLSKNRNLSDIVEKRKYISEALSFIKTVNGEYIQDELLKKVRNLTGVTFESLKRDLENTEGKPLEIKEDFSVKNVNIKDNESDLFAKTERFYLYSIIMRKEYAEDIDYSIELTSEIRNRILDIAIDPSIPTSEIFSKLTEDMVSEYNLILISGDDIDDKIKEKYFYDCVVKIKKNNLKREVDSLNKMFLSETSVDKQTEMLKMIEEKNKELKNLEVKK